MGTKTRMNRLLVVFAVALIAGVWSFTALVDTAWAKPGGDKPGGGKPGGGEGTAPQYIVVPLGSLGGVTGFAGGVNDAGQVVGGSDLMFGSVVSGRRAFSITPETDAAGELVYNRDDDSDGVNDLMVELDLDPSSEENGSWATDINNSGEVVGVSHEPTETGEDYEAHAFLYSDGTMIDLGGLAEAVSSIYGMAGAINDLGQVVGASYPGFGTSTHAFVLTPVIDASGQLVWTDMNGRVNNLMVDLGLPAGESVAFDINNLGQVVGNCSVGAFLVTPEVNATGEFVYVRDDDGNGVNDLMVQLPGLVSGGETEAAAINDLGQILGTARDNRGQLHAVRWDVDNTGTITVADLGTVKGTEHTWGTDINDAGQAVGYGKSSKRSGIDYIGFLWQEGTMYTFDQMLSDAQVWEDTYPVAVNELGITAGFVAPSGQEEPALFVPVTANP